jgi:hypothetical protein
MMKIEQPDPKKTGTEIPAMFPGRNPETIREIITSVIITVFLTPEEWFESGEVYIPFRIGARYQSIIWQNTEYRISEDET